jgi:hypothetical protein
MLGIALIASALAAELVPQWGPAKSGGVRDLHAEYRNIFRHGNRNAASHLWGKFLLDRADQMTEAKLIEMFSGFCAVSGSPVSPHHYNRYRLTLPLVGGGNATGYFHYCCWPCVCDTQDFIRVDTRTVTTLDGTREYRFGVIGNPCTKADALHKPWTDAIHARPTTLAQVAAEVRCDGNVLVNAPLSDHGHVIISMFFDAANAEDVVDVPTPGRIREAGGVQYQHEGEFAAMCEDRKRHNYNSGMGEIFRKVAEIAPIETCASLPEPRKIEEVAGSDGKLSAAEL